MSKNNVSYLCGSYDKSSNSIYFSYYDILKSVGIDEPFKVMKKIKNDLGLNVIKKRLKCTDSKYRYTYVIELSEVIRVIFYLDTDKSIYLRDFFIKELKDKLFNMFSKNMFVSSYEKKK